MPNIDDKLTKIIIEKIHGMSYDEAIENEHYTELKEEMYMDGSEETVEISKWGFPITLPRVMQALNKLKRLFLFDSINQRILEQSRSHITPIILDICNWQLLNDNKQDCTLSEQTPETKEALYKLLTN